MKSKTDHKFKLKFVKNPMPIPPPLSDQIKREKQVKSKRIIPFKKGRLTKTQRQSAYHAPTIKHDGYKGPKGEKRKGNPPLKNNPRKERLK